MNLNGYEYLGVDNVRQSWLTNKNMQLYYWINALEHWLELLLSICFFSVLQVKDG
jgi:hypothetical protein